MKIVYSLEPILDKNTSIFLAGPTVRVDSETDFSSVDSWRLNAIRELEKQGFCGTVYVPEFRDNTVPQDWTYSRQVSWEHKALESAKAIMFWIPRDKDTLPAFTTNIEFGQFYLSGKIAIGSPPNTYKNRYLEEVCSMKGIKWNYTLTDTVTSTLSLLDTKTVSKIFFTSDNHWGEARTLELSKRPFATVEEMDWQMVMNWNITVGDNDIVYHLGDWGSPKMIRHLKGKQIYIVRGNYDKIEVLEELVSERLDRVVLLNEGHEVTFNNLQYKLVHYPENMADLNAFYLFGHTHHFRTMSKGKHGTGLNVGVDVHHYKPVSLETIEFYRTAIEKYYDHSVFPE